MTTTEDDLRDTEREVSKINGTFHEQRKNEVADKSARGRNLPPAEQKNRPTPPPGSVTSLDCS
jgi:hypothetical protein